MVIKERFQQQKLAKEKELADLVAMTTTITSKVEIQVTDDESETAQDGVQQHVETPEEIERRIKRLEKHNDTWLSVLDPLLSNMTRTLNEMKTHGKGTPLLMGEFIIDMAAEARRSMISIAPVDGRAKTEKPVTFEGFDGTHQPTEPQVTQDTTLDTTVRVKKSGRGRSPSRIARLRLPLDQPPETTAEETPQVEKREDAQSGVQTITVQEKTSLDSCRTPQQHEFEAHLSIQRRIQAQENMMDQLMTKWGLPTPRASQDSTRMASTMIAEAMQNTKSHSRSSSQSTVKPVVVNAVNTNGTAHDIGDIKGAPLIKYWLKENLEEFAGRANRRGSRRWSSAGERVSWRPGDNGFMNVLMQELRSTSRLSLESKGDVENFL